MIRNNKKATKIAFDILGKPDNMRKDGYKKPSKNNANVKSNIQAENFFRIVGR